MAAATFTGSDGVAADNADAFGFSLDPTGGTDADGDIVLVDPGFAAGDKLTLNVGDSTFSYVFTADDVAATSAPEEIAAAAFKNMIDASDENVQVDYDPGTAAGTLTVTNLGTTSISVSGQYTNAGAGGLGGMATIDVSTAGAASASLGTIETLIDTAIDAASSFGSVQGRIETQSSFVTSLTDSLKTGIGSLVDADMEEASARLQALQVQQQLGIQSLSIANQAPQSILSLFR